MAAPTNAIPYPDFDDGDVVVCARSPLDPDEKRFFRVHRAVLARHSTLFHEIIVSEGFQGHCIEVHEKADDMAFLLGLFYALSIGAKHIPMRNFATQTLVLLKLATKYGANTPRKIAAFHLMRACPPTLRGWDQRRRAELALSRDADKLLGKPGADDVFPDPAACIRAARDCGVRAVLPAAFYDLCALVPPGCSRNEGGLDTCRLDTAQLRAGYRSATWKILDGRDLLDFIAVGDRFRKQSFMHWHHVAIMALSACQCCAVKGEDVKGVKGADCKCGFATDRVFGHEDARAQLMRDPLSYIKATLNVTSLVAEGMCVDRATFVTCEGQKLRENIWDDFVQYFADQ